VEDVAHLQAQLLRQRFGDHDLDDVLGVGGRTREAALDDLYLVLDAGVELEPGARQLVALADGRLAQWDDEERLGPAVPPTAGDGQPDDLLHLVGDRLVHATVAHSIHQVGLALDQEIIDRVLVGAGQPVARTATLTASA
jgi:hypothetical protein